MMKSYLGLLLSVVLYSPAHAGTDWAERGNGGDVIVCQNGLHLMYDVYETEKRYNLKVQFPSVQTRAADRAGQAQKWSQITGVAQQLIDRLKVMDVKRWKTYSGWLQSFYDDSRFVDGAELLDVPDTGIGFIPKGCELKQLVIQHEPKFPFDRRYIISNDYWSRMSIEHAAAAVVHEILYRDAITQKPGVNTSEPIRYFHAMILSNEVSNMAMPDYQELLQMVFDFNK